MNQSLHIPSPAERGRPAASAIPIALRSRGSFAGGCRVRARCFALFCALIPTFSRLSAGEGDYGDAYVDSSIGDASILNPVLMSDSASSDIAGLVFNGLVKYDKDIQLVGDLAESWTVTQGGLVITFRLRKGVHWHDGKPFTADDVLF